MKKYELPQMEFLFLEADVITTSGSLTDTGTNLDATNKDNEGGNVEDIFGW